MLSDDGSPPREPGDRVCAVVVTHNRIDLLKECIEAIRLQTRAIDGIVVVNNGSSDGTAIWLAQQLDVTAVHQHDAGSAGGQHRGILEAYCSGYDWFWCMDDDTIPHPEALKKLLSSHVFGYKKIGFLHSCAYQPDGRLNSGVAYLKRMAHQIERGAILAANGDWVSLLVSRAAVKSIGLPIKEFFIDFCDVEFTKRILDGGFQGYWVLDSQVLHKQPPKRSFRRGPLNDWERIRFYCTTRNSLITFRLRHGYGPLGKQVGNGKFGKSVRCGWAIARCLRAIVTGKVPLGTVRAIYEGLTWRPNIEFPDCHTYRQYHRLRGDRDCISEGGRDCLNSTLSTLD